MDFKLSTAPQFIDKVRHVVGLYLNPPDAAVVSCVDEDTKTHAARRIALDPETLAALQRRRKRAEALARECRCELDPGAFVFSATPDGSAPRHPDTVTTSFHRLCRRLGLASVRLHDLRHLHATQLLAAGVPVHTVGGRLGHANAATTLIVYAHFLEASDRQAADVIAGLLESSHGKSKL